MVVRKTILLLFIAAVPFALQAAESEQLVRQIELPNAGIVLGIPVGYVPAPLIDANQISHFVWAPQTGEATAPAGRVKDIGRNVSLWTYPAGPADTAKEFLEDWTSPSEQKLDKVKILIATHIRIDGLDGLARSTTFKQAGNNFSAATVCFIRNIDIPASIANQATGIDDPKTVRLAYILRLEVPESQKDALLPTLDQIVKTIMLTDLRRPIEVPLEFSNGGEFHLRSGLAIREMTGWFKKLDEQGVTMTQPDFILDGTFTPSIRISEQAMTPSENFEAIGLAEIDRDRQAGTDIEIVSQGKVGDGYRFVLYKTPGQPATQPSIPPTSQPATQPSIPVVTPVIDPAAPVEPVLEVRRYLANPNVKPNQPQCVVLTLTAQGCDVDTAEYIMESLAGGILPAPATKPVAEKKTTCASQPATVKSQP